MKALLNNFRKSSRKVRLVTNLLKGKSVTDALTTLRNTAKGSVVALEKLLKSAIANAKAQGKDEKALFIKTFKVNPGVTMKRMMPRARGSAYRINKRTSHVILELGEKEESFKHQKTNSKKLKNEKV